GGLVRDLCIFKDKKSIYHRFSFAHSTKQKSYFLLKYNLLKRFLSKPTERSWHDKRTNNVYEEIKTQSFTHKLFSELYEKWYVEGRKIIHDDIWNLDETGLGTIYFDRSESTRLNSSHVSNSYAVLCFGNKRYDRLIACL